MSSVSDITLDVIQPPEVHDQTNTARPEEVDMIISGPIDTTTDGVIDHDQAYRQNVHRVGRGGLINIIGFFSGAGLGFLYTYVLSHLLPADNMGLYSLGWTLLNLLVIPASLGFDWGLWKFVPMLRAQNDQSGIVGVVASSLMIVVPWSIALGGAVIIFSHPLAVSVFHKPHLDLVLRAFGVILPIFVLGLMYNSVCQGLQDMRSTVYSKKLIEPLLRLIGTVIAIALGWQMGGVLVAGIVAVVSSTLLALYFMWRAIPRHIRADRSRVSVRELFVFSAPQTFTTLFSYLLLYTDTLILGIFASAAKVAAYYVTTQILLLAALALGTLLPAFAPMIASLHSQGQFRQMNQLFQRVARWILTLSLPIFVCQAVFAHALLTAFRYPDPIAATALIILVGGQLWNALTGPLGPMILMPGRPFLPMINNVSVALFNVVLCLILIPHWGLIGAATANAIATITINTVQLIEVWVLMKTYPFSLGYLKPLASAGVAVVAGVGIQLFVGQFIHHVFLPIIILEMGVTGFIYGGVLFALGLEKDDKRFVGDLVQRFRSPMPA